MATDVDTKEYQLRCELRGHESDARGICICGSSGIATSSRDKTVRYWTMDVSDRRKYTCSKVLLGHSSFVGPLAWIPSSTEFPDGRIVSGGLDTMIIVWDLRTGDRIRTLAGHKLQVTGISVDNEDIISCSMDCSLRRWKNGQVAESWEGHNSAIQAVLKLPSGNLVTGSSDASLKLWNGSTCIRTFIGHSDTIRGLAFLDDLGILSASHDGTIRLWELTGQVLMDMVGHTSIVYSVDSHESGYIVSGSEDCSAKIWKGGVCVQTLEHPGCVWDVKFLKNGDIVTACSDGVVRIWTSQQDMVDLQVVSSYISQLSMYKLTRKKVGGLKLDELPGVEALKIPGAADGQTKIIREGDNGAAYSWNLRQQQWEKIGEVVDGPDDAMKGSMHDGTLYDYVFDVDIEDGEPVRKLPYNRKDNPYTVADQWLIKENLPLSYRQQIVEFIHQNTGQKSFEFDASFRDPYTGGSAYLPGETSTLIDVSSKSKFKHIPKKGMLVFDVAQFDGILKKIAEFNGTLLSDPNKAMLALLDNEMSRIGAIVKILKDTSHYHMSRFADIDITLLLKMLKSWPVDSLFPALDILRMIVLHPDGEKLRKNFDDSDDTLQNIIDRALSQRSILANILTSVRVVTNLFKNSSYNDWLLSHRCVILDAYSSCSSSPNKNLQLAYSTLLLNYAVLLIEKKDQEGQCQVLSAALEVAEEAADSDSRYRALVAIGSLMLDGLMSKIAKDFDVENIAQLMKKSKESRIAEVGADIEKLIVDN